MAFLDATVVNIALPAIGSDLAADVTGLTWTVNAYTLTLAAFVLVGGSLGDRFGRRRIFMVGVAWFGVASLVCALATGIGMLVAARALQGVGAALLTPGALAILQTSFRAEDRSRAIGAWSGLAGMTGAVGPFLGGWLVEVGSWRWIFLLNLPVVVAVIAIAARHVPESRDLAATGRLDFGGAGLAALGLGSLTYGLSLWSEQGAGSLEVQAGLGLGLVALVGFVARERVASRPMLPLGVFAAPRFGATNLVTFLVYAALGGVFFWLVVALQVVSGWSPLTAGLSLLPVTVLMLLFSPPFDRTALDPGYIKGYIPGVRENGGQYTHAAIWSVIALAPSSAAPGWFYGIFLILIFAFLIPVFPPGGLVDIPPPEGTLAYALSVVRHMALPVAAMFISTIFISIYSWRTFFLIHSSEDYVEMARAKGLPSRLIERRYILRPTLSPIITSFALMLIGLWSGAIILEQVFNWPGLGTLLFQAIGFRDTPVIIGSVVIFAYLLAVTVFVLDILYAVLDPRVRVGPG